MTAVAVTGTKECMRCRSVRDLRFYPHGASWCTVCTGDGSDSDSDSESDGDDRRRITSSTTQL